MVVSRHQWKTALAKEKKGAKHDKKSSKDQYCAKKSLCVHKPDLSKSSYFVQALQNSLKEILRGFSGCLTIRSSSFFEVILVSF